MAVEKFLKHDYEPAPAINSAGFLAALDRPIHCSSPQL